MSKKKNNMQLSINVPDENIMKHITNAYGLVCQYRTVNKAPHESIENWMIRLVVEGCNALYKYHNEQLAKQQEVTASDEEKKDEVKNEKI